MSDSTYAQNADDVQRKSQEQVAELRQRERKAFDQLQTSWLMDATTLAEMIERLSRSLSDDAAKLREAIAERNIHKFVVNPLGVIQGEGAAIDMRCAKLAAKVERIEEREHALNTVGDILTMLQALAKQARDAQYMRDHNR